MLIQNSSVNDEVRVQANIIMTNLDNIYVLH